MAVAGVDDSCHLEGSTTFPQEITTDHLCRECSVGTGKRKITESGQLCAYERSGGVVGAAITASMLINALKCLGEEAQQRSILLKRRAEVRVKVPQQESRSVRLLGPTREH